MEQTYHLDESLTYKEAGFALRKVLSSRANGKSYDAIERLHRLPPGSIRAFLQRASKDPEQVVTESDRQFLVSIEEALNAPFGEWLTPKTATDDEATTAAVCLRIDELMVMTGHTLNSLSGAVADATHTNPNWLPVFMTSYRYHDVYSRQGFPSRLSDTVADITGANRSWIYRGEGPKVLPGFTLIQNGHRSLANLLAVLKAHGIALARQGDDIVPDDPQGALTPDLEAEVRYHRQELLSLIAPTPRTPPPSAPEVPPQVPRTEPPRADSAPMPGLSRFVTTFKGQRLATITLRDGRRCWVAAQVSLALGHDVKYLSKKIAGEWGREFERGTHFDVATGEQLRELRRLLGQVPSEGTCPIPGLDANVGRLTILFEPGLWLTLGKSEGEAGVAFRHHYSTEIMPRINRDGFYAVPGALDARLAAMKGEIMAAVWAEIQAERDARALDIGAIQQAQAATQAALVKTQEALTQQTQLLTVVVAHLNATPTGKPPAASTDGSPTRYRRRLSVANPDKWQPADEVFPRLLQAMADRKWTHEQLSLQSMLSGRYWQTREEQWQQKKFDDFNVKTINHAAATLGCSATYLFRGLGPCWPNGQPPVG